MPKIMGTSIIEHRKHIRSALFDALSELLKTQTFDTLTMSQIAAEAGIGRTAVYNHFPDKEALLLAYISNETGKYSLRLRKALEGTSDPIKQLRIYIREQLLLGATYRLAPSRDLRLIVSDKTGKELHEHANLVEEVLRDILAAAMSAGRIPKQSIPLLITIINSTLAGHRLPTDQRMREYMILCIQSFVLRGLGVRTTEVPIPDPQQVLGRVMTHADERGVELSGSLGMAGCPVHQVA